ncbi:TnpV protein, partial [Acutalibacter muris]
GHLTEIEQAANRRLELLMPQLKESMGLTEQMKAIDPMKWVGLMNNAKAKAEEVILSELIYQ